MFRTGSHSLSGAYESRSPNVSAAAMAALRWGRDTSAPAPRPRLLRGGPRARYLRRHMQVARPSDHLLGLGGADNSTGRSRTTRGGLMGRAGLGHWTVVSTSTVLAVVLTACSPPPSEPV